MMLMHFFDYTTGLYTGSQYVNAGDFDPRDPSTLLIPGNATLMPPPRCGKGLHPCWNGSRWVPCVIEQDTELEYHNCL
jgi:hypothetical protein